MNEKLASRSMSGFPVSIGTGMALETLFDPVQAVYDDTRQAPDKVNLNDYTNYIFNVSTLLRNLTSAVPSSDILTISKKDILDALLDEISYLTEFFHSEGLTINFYTNNYAFVKQTYEKEGILRKATTDKQMALDNIVKYCLDFISKQDEVGQFTNAIHYEREDQALIFTHVPWDLLSYGKFVKLDLLESHTGLIKSRKLWNTKYYPIPDHDMSFLPFMEKLLVTFGDNVMFKPAPVKERIDLWNAMKKKGVNPLTSELSFEFMFGGNK